MSKSEHYCSSPVLTWKQTEKKFSTWHELSVNVALLIRKAAQSTTHLTQQQTRGPFWPPSTLWLTKSPEPLSLNLSEPVPSLNPAIASEHSELVSPSEPHTSPLSVLAFQLDFLSLYLKLNLSVCQKCSKSDPGLVFHSVLFFFFISPRSQCLFKSLHQSPLQSSYVFFRQAASVSLWKSGSCLPEFHFQFVYFRCLCASLLSVAVHLSHITLRSVFLLLHLCPFPLWRHLTSMSFPPVEITLTLTCPLSHFSFCQSHTPQNSVLHLLLDKHSTVLELYC